MKKNIDRQNFEELLTGRRARFEEVKQLYGNGHTERALSLLNGLGEFFTQEADMKAYKASVYASLLSLREANFCEKDYPRVIHYYSLLEKYSPGQSGDSTPVPYAHAYTSDFRRFEVTGKTAGLLYN